jgi:hypothetical protein
MGEVEGSCHRHPNFKAHRLLLGGALPGRREYVQSQDGLAAVC